MVPRLLTKKRYQEELGILEQQFQSWAEAYVSGSGKWASTALLLKGTGKDKAGELEELLKNLEEERGRVFAASGDRKEVVAKYEQFFTEFKERDFELAERKKKLFEIKRREEDRISVAMAENSSKLDHRRQKVDALRKATTWYNELLGIRCEYSDSVKFIFTRIDPIDPDREFIFSMHHDRATDRFSMVDCNPPVENIVSLLEALNSSNELSQFVRSMRWEFVGAACRGDSSWRFEDLQLYDGSSEPNSPVRR